MMDGLTAELTYAVAAVAYAVAAVGFGLWTTRLQAATRRVGYALVAMIVLSAASMLLMALEIGTVPVGGEEMIVPRFVADMVAYPLVLAVTAAIAGTSRRLVLGATGVMAAMRIGFEIASVTDGLVAAISGLTMVLGYGVLIWLLWGPGWRAADKQSDQRRLLYWKCRNLIVFLLGILIVLGVLALIEPTNNRFIIEAARQYMDLWIRVGYAGFVFISVDAVEATDWFDLFDPAAWVS